MKEFSINFEDLSDIDVIWGTGEPLPPEFLLPPPQTYQNEEELDFNLAFAIVFDIQHM